MTTELATRDDVHLVRLDPQALIEQAISKGAGMDTLERLVALAKEVRAQVAREAWYAAMADFQRRCPPIKKTKRAEIRSARGGYAYSYAPLDEILSTIQPVMGDVGLSVAWSTKVEAERVVAACRISHALGHAEDSGEIAIPINLGQAEGVGANPAQRVGIAMTYAKRYSLLGIIGMAPEDDDDGKSGERQGPGRVEPDDPAGIRAGGVDPDAIISEGQLRRFHAIASGAKWTPDQVHDFLAGHKYNSSKEIRLVEYDALVDRLKQGPGAKASAA